jgi:hypothetical protein
MIWCRLLAALATGDAYSQPMLHEALIMVSSKRRYQIIMTRYAMYLLLVNLKISNDYWTVPAIISREWKLATGDHWVDAQPKLFKEKTQSGLHSISYTIYYY